MAKITEHPLEDYQTWTTGRLGGQYMNMFSFVGKFEGASEELRKVIGILAERNFNERLEIYRELQRLVQYQKKVIHGEELLSLREDMLSHYHLHILGEG